MRSQGTVLRVVGMEVDTVEVVVVIVAAAAEAAEHLATGMAARARAPAWEQEESLRRTC